MGSLGPGRPSETLRRCSVELVSTWGTVRRRRRPAGVCRYQQARECSVAADYCASPAVALCFPKPTKPSACRSCLELSQPRDCCATRKGTFMCSSPVPKSSEIFAAIFDKSARWCMSVRILAVRYSRERLVIHIVIDDTGTVSKTATSHCMSCCKHALWYSVVESSKVFSIVRYSTAQCSTAQYSTVLQYSTVRYRYRTVQYSTVQCRVGRVVSYRMVSCRMM